MRRTADDQRTTATPLVTRHGGLTDNAGDARVAVDVRHSSARIEPRTRGRRGVGRCADNGLVAATVATAIAWGSACREISPIETLPV
jgi:hypothetical protein